MTAFRNGTAVVLLLAPVLAGCGTSLSDYSIKDQEWFSRPARMFNRSVSIETPPLSMTAPVGPADLINGDGSCAGVAPTEANAMADGQPAPTGSVALGHTECDVARAAGTPDNVNISANERGERAVVLTYNRGPRPGIYRFVAGRLTEVEAAPAAVAPERPAKRARKKQA
jgi:hypothetical protein